MNMFRNLLIFLVILNITGCASSSIENNSTVNQDTPAQKLFKQAEEALKEKQYKTAAKLFDEVERQHPYSDYANRAQLLSGEAFYLNQNYDDAVMALDRYLELHPGSSDIDYAYYLKALCFYEQISDVERDQAATTKAKEALKEVYMRFPNTEYANEARLKYDLTIDHLAGKEMTIGRYYLNRNEYIGAMNRFNAVIQDYQTTSQTPEALYRLVEIYTALHLNKDAIRTAAVLGNNFPNSKWYKLTYELIEKEDIL